ncbi:hypothetical protein [Acinetobacter baumannii]|uniref:hypothetical protein n=1 Tax=Acinetobacter baumannii TaxID=470 RepID=UPI00222818FB|nr:hypothetical protein [Acinetobacter baumannii]MCW3176485.1 hypothetical protein [Acinetobacter baumannii]
MNTYTRKILISDEDGNQIEVLAECVDIKSSESLDAPSEDNGYAVKTVLIDGHTVSVGTDGCFYHPDTRALYTV